MSFPAAVQAQSQLARSSPRDGFVKPFIAKALLLAAIALASAGGIFATDGAATARVITSAGADWANLLRAMAVLKLLLAGAVTAAVMWRLSAPISATRWGCYALAAVAVWTGPGLIWGLVHIALGALLLHCGLIATAILVWCDPAARERLSDITSLRVK